MGVRVCSARGCLNSLEDRRPQTKYCGRACSQRAYIDRRFSRGSVTTLDDNVQLPIPIAFGAMLMAQNLSSKVNLRLAALTYQVLLQISGDDVELIEPVIQELFDSVESMNSGTRQQLVEEVLPQAEVVVENFLLAQR
jgi:hypothetical protein